MGDQDRLQRVMYLALSRYVRAFRPAFADAMARLVADVLFLTSREIRHTVINNLRQVRKYTGPGDQSEPFAAMARRVFRHFSLYITEFFRCRPVADLMGKNLIRIEGIENLKCVMNNGKGAVVATVHLGNWEVLGAALVGMGYPTNAVVLRHKDRQLDQLFQKTRGMRGYRSIMADEYPMRLVRLLRRGEVVGLLSDWDITRNGYGTEFFGRPVSMPRGPAWLSSRTGAPVVPAFCLFHQPSGGYRLQFRPPVNLSGSWTEKEIQDQMRCVLETAIGRNPDQWLIFHDFWSSNG